MARFGSLPSKILQALSSRERLVLYGATLIFVVSGFTYGALVYKTKTYVVPSEGGTYREGTVGQPSFINPVIPVTETDRVLSRLIFASLEEMADSIKRSEDGQTWNVRIKDGVLWHDGEKLTADDVVFTVDVIHNPDSRSPLRGSFEGVEVARVSELEVEFTLQNPYAFFQEDHLRSLRPIPKHLFADLPVTNYQLTPYGLSPVGSGPYKVKSHAKDARGFIAEFNLEANSAYFTRPPYIEDFVFKFFRKDSELISSYNLGQIDGFGLSTAEPLTERPIIIRHLAHYLSSSRYYAIFINQSVAPEALSELGVRRALAGAIGRSDLIEAVFDGRATPFFGPTGLATNPAASFDSEAIRGLELNLVVPDEPFLVKTAEEVKVDWETLGAKVNLTVRSLRDIREDILRNTSYEMILFGNIVKEGNDLFSFWHSSKRFFPDQNLALYQDSETDALLEEYRRTFDGEVRLNLLDQISNRIAGNVPAVFLYSPDYVYISAPSLGGVDDSRTINTSDDRFANVTEWFVKSRRTFRPPVLVE
ncbi:MAG: ABC transporter substrate-binding protein [Patescibacteria group bacterium]|nr:ABC transporter substrate-binding protein [Patescibacteria group bacterium]